LDLAELMTKKQGELEKVLEKEANRLKVVKDELLQLADYLEKKAITSDEACAVILALLDILDEKDADLEGILLPLPL
jgi:DNA gyrase/topoisomerase IV subunit A